MITLCWLITLSLLAAVQSVPVPSRIHGSGHLHHLLHKKKFVQETPSPFESFEYWTETFFPDIFPDFVVHDHPYHHAVHDPHLLTGREAQRAARLLYRKELFFGDIPHTRAILNNQELRRLNGLPDHNLSSIRINYEIPEARAVSG